MAPELDGNDDAILTFYFIDGEVYSAAPYLVNSASRNEKKLDQIDQSTESEGEKKDGLQEPFQNIDFIDSGDDYQEDNTLQSAGSKSCLCTEDATEEFLGHPGDLIKVDYTGSLASISDSTKVLRSETASVSSDYAMFGSGELGDEYTQTAPYIPQDCYEPTSIPNAFSETRESLLLRSSTPYDVPNAFLEGSSSKDIYRDENKKKNKKFLSRIKKTIGGVARNVEKSSTIPMHRTPSFAYSSTFGLFPHDGVVHSFYASARLSYLDLQGEMNLPSHEKKEKWWRFWKKRYP